MVHEVSQVKCRSHKHERRVFSGQTGSGSNERMFLLACSFLFRIFQMIKNIRRKVSVKSLMVLFTLSAWYFSLLLWMLNSSCLFRDLIIRLFLRRGVSINVLRHEAEFYGITPLGTCLPVFVFGIGPCVH